MDLQHPEAPPDVGRGDEHLAVEAAGAQQRRVELVEQVRGGDHDHAPVGGEAVHLHQQLVEGLVLLAGDVRAAAAADGVELVDEDDRRFVLAGLREQAPDAGRAEAGEHLHEGGRRLGEELRLGLVGHGLRQQRLARARRAVQQDPLRHRRPERVEGLRFAQELDDLLQLRAGIVHARDVVEGDGRVGGGLDLLRLDARHHLQGAQHHEDDRREEDDHQDGLPVVCEVLDFLAQRGVARGRTGEGVGGGGAHGGGDAGVGRGGVDARGQGRAFDGCRAGGVRAVVGDRRGGQCFGAGLSAHWVLREIGTILGIGRLFAVPEGECKPSNETLSEVLACGRGAGAPAGRRSRRHRRACRAASGRRPGARGSAQQAAGEVLEQAGGQVEVAYVDALVGPVDQGRGFEQRLVALGHEAVGHALREGDPEVA